MVPNNKNIGTSQRVRRLAISENYEGLIIE
jgi:hypothetical protein